MNQPEKRQVADQSDRPSDAPLDAAETVSHGLDASKHVEPTQEFGSQSSGEPGSSLQLPPELGRYRIVKQLGAGGFGTVYLGHDDELERRVAIKVPHWSKAKAEDFLDEARRLAQLRHPGIVTVHDVCRGGESCFIVTEFVEGESLYDAQARGGIRWEDAVDIVARLADALAHAHANGMIHRDIKPGNIILRPDGSPVLLDFGLALTDSEATAPDGSVKGTPAYMAPEQARGQAHRVDGRTDIFSLATVLYEMLTTRRAFRGDSVHETLRRVVDDDPQPLRQLVPGIPPAISTACEKAMAKRMGDRFTTAGDFAAALREGRVGEGHSAIPEGAASEPVLPPESSSTSPPSSRERRAGAERRHVSLAIFSFEVLSDEGSTDAEDQHEVARAFQQLATESADEYGGTVVPTSGQEVMLCFGYPSALEYSAHRAVRAALQMHTAANSGWIARQEEQFGCRVSVWAVVHSGDVVIEDSGTESSRGIVLTGDARNLIARLESVAEPNAVSMSASTCRLVEGFFDFESMQPQRIRGVADPVALFRVLGETNVGNRVDLVDADPLSELVGRDTELSILKDRWEQALEGLGQVVLLIGDAGLGKSRLIRELRNHVSNDDESVEVIEIRSSPYHQSAGFFPFTEYFQRLLEIDQDQTAADNLARIVGHLERLDLRSPENVLVFASLLNVDTGPSYKGVRPVPQRQKELTEEFLLDWLEARSREDPVLFVVEDLHWLDASTLEVLARHIERRSADRLLTLLTCRPEFERPWQSASHLTQIVLNRLTKRQIGNLLRKRLDRENLAETLVSQVVERTDGVPLFIEEYAKLIQETGILDDEQTPTESVILRMIPDTLQDLLLARLDRLDSDLEIVHIAATIGREFTHQLLALAAGVPDDLLKAELGKLIDSELIYRKGRPPNAIYSFKHALIQDAAYGSLLRKQRQEYHRRIAESLSQHFPDVVETQPELLALHCTRGGETEKAVHHWLRAGRRSQARSSNVEAVSQLESGLELLDSLPDSRERDQLELDFRLPLSASLMGARGYAAPEVEAVLSQSRALCERLGPESPIFGVMWGMWAWRFIREELPICRDLAKEILDFAATRNEKGMLAEADFTWALTQFYLGEFPDALQYCRRGVERFDLEQSIFYSQFTNQNSGVIMRAYVGILQCYMGFLDQALEALESAEELVEELQHPFSSACEAYLSGFAFLQRGDLDRATDKAEKAIRISDDQGFPFWKGLGRLCRGGCATMRGDNAAAMEDLREGIRIVRGTGAAITLAQYQGYLALAEWRSGEREQAQRDLNVGLEQVDRLGGRWCLPFLLRVQAEIGAGREAGGAVDAENHLRKSLSVAAEQQARLSQLRTAIALFRLLESQQRGAEAMKTLADVYAEFDEGLSTADCSEARAIIEANQQA